MASAVSLCSRRWYQRSRSKTTLPAKKVTTGNLRMTARHSFSASATASVPIENTYSDGTSSSVATEA